MNRFCPNCGAEFKDDSQFCTNCGFKKNVSEVVTAVEYVGFWPRLLAYIIDLFAVMVVGFVVGFFIGLFFPNFVTTTSEDKLDSIFNVIGLLICWLYFSILESSSWQGTFGKKALQIKVVNYEGGKISFIQATARFFAKIISGVIFGVGYLMIAFTEKKQGLHDSIVKTLVIKQTR